MRLAVLYFHCPCPRLHVSEAMSSLGTCISEHQQEGLSKNSQCWKLLRVSGEAAVSAQRRGSVDF